MDADKKVDLNDLPKQPERTTTQQPEEYIDKSNLEKDETDTPGKKPADDAGDVRRRQGHQESNLS